MMIQFGSAAKRYMDNLEVLETKPNDSTTLTTLVELKRQLTELMDKLSPADEELKRQTTRRRESMERLTKFADGTLLVASRNDVRDLLELARLAVSIANDVTDELMRRSDGKSNSVVSLFAGKEGA